MRLALKNTGGKKENKEERESFNDVILTEQEGTKPQ